MVTVTSPGGYRKPTDMAAVVSGPGQLSRRTDAGQQVRDLPNAKYGESKAFVEQQQGAPLAEAQPLPGSPAPTTIGDLAAAVAEGRPRPLPQPGVAPTPFGAATTRPGEPVTAGNLYGPGPGPMGRPQPRPSSLTDAIAPFLSADSTGILADVLSVLAEQGL